MASVNQPSQKLRSLTSPRVAGYAGIAAAVIAGATFISSGIGEKFGKLMGPAMSGDVDKGNTRETHRLNVLQHYERLHNPEITLSAEEKVQALAMMYESWKELKKEQPGVFNTSGAKFSGDEMPGQDELPEFTMESITEALDELHADESKLVTRRAVESCLTCADWLKLDAETRKKLGLDEAGLKKFYLLGVRRCLESAKNNPDPNARRMHLNEWREHRQDMMDRGLDCSPEEAGVADVTVLTGLSSDEVERQVRSKGQMALAYSDAASGE